jgi:hypothetical protein
VRAELLKIPPVTRTIVLTTIGATLPAVLSLIHPYYLILSWPHIVRRWELWRIFSAFGKPYSKYWPISILLTLSSASFFLLCRIWHVRRV